ncbi:uncharacterized protein UHOD_11616 [Ustilago sp. UG-2017b]|nr:uncharacterized protein UHOD_11616 [Ustilago sp. UG-2017b]
MTALKHVKRSSKSFGLALSSQVSSTTAQLSARSHLDQAQPSQRRDDSASSLCSRSCPRRPDGLGSTITSTLYLGIRNQQLRLGTARIRGRRVDCGYSASGQLLIRNNHVSGRYHRTSFQRNVLSCTSSSVTSESGLPLHRELLPSISGTSTVEQRLTEPELVPARIYVRSGASTCIEPSTVGTSRAYHDASSAPRAPLDFAGSPPPFLKLLTIKLWLPRKPYTVTAAVTLYVAT